MYQNLPNDLDVTTTEALQEPSIYNSKETLSKSLYYEMGLACCDQINLKRTFDAEADEGYWYTCSSCKAESEESIPDFTSATGYLRAMTWASEHSSFLLNIDLVGGGQFPHSYSIIWEDLRGHEKTTTYEDATIPTAFALCLHNALKARRQTLQPNDVMGKLTESQEHRIRGNERIRTIQEFLRIAEELNIDNLSLPPFLVNDIVFLMRQNQISSGINIYENEEGEY